MIISSHNVQLNSSASIVKHYEKTETLDAWDKNKSIHISTKDGKTEASEQVNSSQTQSLPNNSQSLHAGAFTDVYDKDIALLFDSAKLRYPNKGSYTNSTSSLSDTDSDENLPVPLKLAKMLLEKVFGIKVDIIDMDENTNQNSGNAVRTEQQSDMQEQTELSQEAQVEAENLRSQIRSNNGQPVQRSATSQGWGINYSYHEVNYEKESVSFAAQGEVTTEDGRNITFDARMEMSSEKLKEVSIQFKAGDALLDPLALNFDGRGVQLTDEKYSFDLNNDGNAENVSFLKSGSGFLALDNNNNGTVDNGSELFGPQNNQGFLELKAYDSDNNNWIDEVDPVFGQLRIWTKDVQGNDILSTLKEYNVGAIYLDSSDTPFELAGGKLRETGIYLKETGEVNVIQEVDLAT